MSNDVETVSKEKGKSGREDDGTSRACDPQLWIVTALPMPACRGLLHLGEVLLLFFELLLHSRTGACFFIWWRSL